MSDKKTPGPFIPEHTDCPEWGKGGRYEVIDGKRVPVAPPAESQDVRPSADKPIKGGK